MNLSDTDELYILGDMVDRGPEPIKVLQDVMLRSNAYPILGNHDYMAWKVLSRFAVEITERNAETQLRSEDLVNYMYWSQDGGSVTAKQFRQLETEERQDILDYIADCSVFEDVFVDDKRFVLVHADIHSFSEDRDLEDYDISDFLFHRADYDKRYFSRENTFLITGHTPTMMIREDGKPLVYQENGHIALDCGCVYGGRLAAYCLDTQKIYYVDAEEKYYP
ncbi:MAG: metallophosphoesterase [Clostridia bacterium]|nr:metallophosphoesterase [Clostridia bacterium]